MEKRILLLVVILMGVGLWSSAALALPPIGPPKAGLDKDQLSAAFEYGYSDMDLKGTGELKAEAPTAPWSGSFKWEGEIEDFKSNMYFGNLGYGITDNWEAFVRLGAGDLELEDELEFGSGFAWGFGTKMTFAQEGALTWGGLFQMTWFNPGDEDVIADETWNGDSLTASGDLEIDWWEIQIAVGPTWQMNDSICIYGGPFLHFVDGNAEGKSTGTANIGGTDYPVSAKESVDFEEDSVFGGFVGAQFDINENTSWNIEYQLTGDAWAIGTGIVWRF